MKIEVNGQLESKKEKKTTKKKYLKRAEHRALNLRLKGGLDVNRAA
jgi:hypothetical protein